LLGAHAIEDVTVKNSIFFDECSSILSVWRVMRILEVFRLLLGKEIWG